MKGEVPLEFKFVQPFFLWFPCVQVLETLKTSGWLRPAIFTLSNPTSNGEVLLFAICISLCKLNSRQSLLSFQWLKVKQGLLFMIEFSKAVQLSALQKKLFNMVGQILFLQVAVPSKMLISVCAPLF